MRRVQEATAEGRASRDGDTDCRAIGPAARCGAALAYLLASFVALATGARRGEVLAIRWQNVDLERGTIRIVESLEQTKTGLRFKSPKSDRARAVTVPKFAVEELCRLKREQAEALLALGVRQIGR